MRIISIRLRNWRTFRRLDVTLGQRLVVIGPNAAGKSNMLDSVRFLRDLALSGCGLQEAVQRRGGVGRVRCLFADTDEHGRVGIDITLGDDEDPGQWRYSLAFTEERGPRHRVVLTREVVRRGGDVLLSRPDAEDEEDPERLTQTALEQISENKRFREVAEFLAETRYLHLVPQVIRDPARAGDVADDPFGGDFIARMNRVPAEIRNARLRRVTEALRLAIPQFESLEVDMDPAGRPHLTARYTNWRESGASVHEGDLSDGTLRLIGLLWALVEVGERGSPVLLEEPELSLHPSVVRVLPSVMARAQRATHAQVLLTTHSPELLVDEGVRPDEVLLLLPTDEGTVGQLVSDDEQMVALVDSGLNVAEVALPRTEPPDVMGLARVDVAAR